VGFIVEHTDYKLVFEDPKYAGLEVTMRGMNTGAMLDLMALAGSVDMSNLDKARLSDQAGPIRDILNMVIDNLVAWNVQTMHDGQVTDVPPTRDGVRRQPITMVMDIVHAWTGAMSVAGPLEQPSTDGAPSPVESTLAALSSPNQPNSQ
jgi:hypothetical protein